MTHGQAFFVVGHENWGKSRTLKALTGHHQVRWHAIDERLFFIRRMSNDDYPRDWAAAVRSLDVSANPFVIFTVCPKAEAKKSLRELGRKYDLFFWVIRLRQNGGGEVTKDQVRMLKSLGTVEVFEGCAQPRVRATAFLRFVGRNR